MWVQCEHGSLVNLSRAEAIFLAESKSPDTKPYQIMIEFDRGKNGASYYRYKSYNKKENAQKDLAALLEGLKA